jgi:hypothetical protein
MHRATPFLRVSGAMLWPPRGRGQAIASTMDERSEL